MALPGFFEVGQLYNGGIVNGLLVWEQPGGPGTPVYPQAPIQYPPVYDGYPILPMSYNGFLNFGCGHWANTCEVQIVYDPYTEEQAALCCCPVCSYIQLIVEPASDWSNRFYSIYDTGVNSRAYSS